MRFKSRLVSLVAVVSLVTALLPVGPASGALLSGGAASASDGPIKSPEVATATRSDGVVVTVRNLSREVQGFDVFRSETEGVEGTKINDELVKGSRYFDRSAEAGVQYFYTVKIAEAKTAAAGVSAAAADADVPDVLPQVASRVAKARDTKRDGRTSGAAAAPKKAAVSRAAAEHAPAAPEAVSQMATTIGTGSGVTTITSSTTWSPAGGPYFIRNDVVVASGRTLTILPGTKVYFDTAPSGDTTGTPFAGVQSVTEQIDLIVHGKIVAKGTSTNPVVFTSINSLVESGTADYAAAGDWGTIFTDSMSASEISYCEVEFSVLGVWGHNTSRPYVSNSEFRFTGPSSYPWGAVSFTNPKTDATTPRIKITNNYVAPSDGGEGIDVLLGSLGNDTSDRVVDPYIVGNKLIGPYPLEIYCNDQPYQEAVPSGGMYGNVLLKGTIANNTFTCDDYGVYLEAYAYGEGKTATISTAFSGNTIVSDGSDGVYAYASSSELNGAAYAKPTFSKDKITALSDDGVYVGANAASRVETSTGNAYATPTFTSCSIRSSGGDAVELDASAEGAGTASANAVFSGGTIQTTSTYGVYAWADSAYGVASASPKFTSVTGRSWDASYFLDAEAYAYGAGKAKASPSWVGGSIWSQSEDGINAYAESDEGSAEARPYVSATEIRTYGDCVEASAYASQEGTGTGDASASPTVLDSDLIAIEYDAVYAYADASGSGDAVASPVVKNSALVAEDYYAMDAEAYSDGGAATVSPAITDSTMWAYYPALYAYAYRDGDGAVVANATASPKLTRTTAVSKYDDTLSVEAYNYGAGSATVKPVVSYSDVINSYYYRGLDGYSYADETGTAEISPTMIGSNIKSDYEAIYLYADAYGDAGGVAKANGTFTDCTMSSSWDDGFYGGAYSDGNVAEVKPTFTSCVVEAPNDYAYEVDARVDGTDAKSAVAAPTISGGRVRYSGNGISVDSYSEDESCPATVTAASVIKNMPLVSVWDYGIYNWAYTAGSGDAVNSSSITNCATTSDQGIVNEAICQGAGTATNSAKILGSSSSRRMRVESFSEDGVYNLAYSNLGSAYDRTQTKYLSISSLEEAVYTEAVANGGAEQIAHSAPTIYGNVSDTLWGSDLGGIYVYTGAGGSDSTATVEPAISSNRIYGTSGDGVSFDGNLINGITVDPSSSGDLILSPVITKNTILDASGNGIYVGGAQDADGALSITKNTVTRPRLLGIYILNAEAGTVEQNKVVNPGWGWFEANESNSSCLAWLGADPADALVRGNMFVGARGTAVYYDGGAAKTNYNSFTDCYGTVNRPFNYKASDSETSSVTPYDARYNWWGSSSSSVVSSTVHLPNYSGAKSDIVDFSSQLKYCQPRVTKISVKKYATSVKFYVYFDRPMDKSITYLKFGTSSPYSKYKVNGSWNSAGTVFTGKRSRSGLPTGKTMYFSGAKDLPGNPMYSKSKGFKL